MVTNFREKYGFIPIDTHAHAYTKKEWRCMYKFWKPLQKYLYHRDVTDEEIEAGFPDEAGLAQAYLDTGCVGMPVAWDAETATGDPPTKNDYIAQLCKDYPEAFPYGWACVDPWKGWRALEEAERAIKELGLIGVKFQQTAQAFHVNDKRFYPLWDLLQDLGAPIQLHGGYTGLGTGVPGAMGVKLMHNAIFPDMEDIATEFPRLKIFILHVCDPWTKEATALAMHCDNVYRECSGMWPKYFPEDMHYEMNRRLQDKFVWGTDYPLFPIDQLLEQLEQVLRPNVLEKVLYKNAERILGIKINK